MNGTLTPRNCGNAAARRWLLEALQVTARASMSWLPVLCVLFVVQSRVAAATQSVSWPVGAFIAVLEVAVLQVPLFFVNAGVATALAEAPRSSLWQSCRRAGAAVIAAAGPLWKGMFVRAACVGLAAPLLVYVWGSEKPHHFSPFALYAWAYWMSQCWRMGGVVGFYPWLRFRLGAPPDVCMRLSGAAVRLNRRPLLWFMLSWDVALVVPFLLPWLCPVLEFFWAALLDRAFADIFNMGPGVRAASKATVPSLSLRVAASLPASAGRTVVLPG